MYLEIEIFSKLKLERLGSVYGGWYLCCTNLNEKSRILSLGAGEDISFDTEIANKYEVQVDIFDPTPKAVEHFMLLKKQFGKMLQQHFQIRENKIYVHII